MKKLSLITTCMGRLDHLKKTLPQRIYPGVENIIVDWSCPDNCGEWVEENFKEVKVIRVPGEHYYHRSKSRNTGLKEATGEFICNADADLILNHDFFNYIMPILDQHYMFIAIPFKVFMPALSKIGQFTIPGTVIDPNYKIEILSIREGSSEDNQNQEREDFFMYWTDGQKNIQKTRLSLTGFLIFPRVIYKKIGGFDEIFDTSVSGGEDLDYRIKLLIDGKLIEKSIKTGIIDILEHGNQERIRFLEENDYSKAREAALRKIVNKWDKDILETVLPQHLQKSLL